MTNHGKRDKSSKYLYGVIPTNEERNFGKIGMGDEDVYTIPFKDISAVVSDSQILDYELTEHTIRKHESVLRLIMEEYSVIPSEFGTVIYNNEILQRLMKRGYNSMRDCLRFVEGMTEVGLKAVIKGGTQVENLEFSIDDILEPLRNVAEQSVSGDIFSDRLLMNMSFLVKKNKINLFSDAVTELIKNFPKIKFLYSGPWAPYNFVYIKIGKEGLEIVKK